MDRAPVRTPAPLPVRALKFFVLACLVSFAIQGCAIFGGPQREGGSKLSDAAREAEKKPDEKRKTLEAGQKVEQPPDWDAPTVETSIAPSTVSGAPAAPVAPGPLSRYRRFHVSALAGGGFMSGDNFGGYSTGGLAGGVYPAPRLRVDAAVLYNRPTFESASGLRQAFKNEAELAVDFSGRYYLTPEHTFMGFYPVAGMRVGMLRWDYATPVTASEGGSTRTVENDALRYWAPYVGMGATLIQTRHLHVGGHLTGGFRIYDPHTWEGFQNDVFDDSGFVNFIIETSGLF